MAIHSLATGSDPKVVCGLLAREALKAFSGQVAYTDEAPEYAFFTNLIRLLELYRYDLFAGLSPKGILVRQRAARRSTQNVADQNMSPVKTALELAHREIFGERPTEEVVEFLQRVLTAVRDGQPRSDDDVATVRRFIETFGSRLKDD